MSVNDSRARAAVWSQLWSWPGFIWGYKQSYLISASFVVSLPAVIALNQCRGNSWEEQASFVWITVAAIIVEYAF